MRRRPSSDAGSRQRLSKAALRLFVLLHVALLLTTAPAADVSNRDEAKQKLAARAAAREVLDSLPQLSQTDAAETAVLVEELKRMMLTATHQHETVKDSREAARARVKEYLVTKAGGLIDRAAARANEQSPLPIERTDILAPLGDEWQTQRDAAINLFTEAQFDPVYEAARAAAVLVQKEQLEKAIQYPRFEDLDTRLAAQAPDAEKARTPLARDVFDRLQPWVQSVAVPGGFVFEENQPAIQKLGENVLFEIHKQYDRQIAVIQDSVKAGTVPADCIVRAAIEDLFSRALADSVGVSKPGECPRYPPFTAARNHAAWQAQEIERERLLAFIAQPDTIVIDRADVEKRMEAEPAQHREPEKSRLRLLEVYKEHFRRPLAGRYAAQSKTPVTNQIDVLLLSNDKISGAFLGQIGTALKAVLPPARDAVATRQFAQFFPALNEKKPLTEKMIVFLHDAQTPTLKDLDLLREFLSQEPDFAARPYNAGDLLVETQKRALDTANAAAGPLVKALGSQLRLLTEMESNRIEEIRRYVTENKPVAEIKEAWKNDLEQDWKRHADSGPAPALFARTEQQLDKTIRQLYNALKAEMARPQTDASQATSPQRGDA